MRLLDTTLRDGLQGVGFSLSVNERLTLANLLDQAGVDYIEAGFPSSNPQTRRFLSELEAQSYLHKIYLFGATRKAGEQASESANLLPLLNSPFPGAVIVGKTWPLHIQEVLRSDKQENLKMIQESVELLKERGKKVIYDAEHFFDAYRADPDYALQCLDAAASSDWLTLCDTNGSSTPEQISEAVGAAMELGHPLGIHTHNDCELAVANSLAAVSAGAELVQGTVNGVGERCGNANLVSIIANLHLKQGRRMLSQEQLATLTHLSRSVDELLNQNPNPKQPYVGEHAFTHKGGMHAAGMERHRETFEHIDPALVGNYSSVTVSELAGGSSLRQKAEEMNINLSPEALGIALERIKSLEERGYLFEIAEASLWLLLTGRRSFVVDDFEVTSTPEASLASLTLRGRSDRFDGKGRGPVEALDQALRSAIKRDYPQVAKISLTDYKVHIIDSRQGTGATTRVMLQAGDNMRSWTSTGVSGNIIEASKQALEDAYNYGINCPPEQA